MTLSFDCKQNDKLPMDWFKETKHLGQMEHFPLIVGQMVYMNGKIRKFMRRLKMIKIRFLIVICSIVPYVILRHLWGYSHKLPDNVCKRTGCCYGDDNPFP